MEGGCGLWGCCGAAIPSAVGHSPISNLFNRTDVPIIAWVWGLSRNTFGEPASIFGAALLVLDSSRRTRDTDLMHIRVRYFAFYREQLGRSTAELDLPEGADVAALWRACVGDHPRLVRLWDATAVAINGEYAGRDAALHDGDEVAFLPPVSGGSPRCSLVEGPIDVAALEAQVGASRHGAVVVFLGVVRETSPTGKLVRYLEYEAYAGMAETEMEAIAVEMDACWDGCSVAMVHRVGRLEIGEASVAIAVGTPHRAAAFEACRFAIDRLKQTVPIWKKEVFTDGSQWVGVGA